MQSSLKRYFTSTAALSAFIGFLVLFSACAAGWGYFQAGQEKAGEAVWTGAKAGAGIDGFLKGANAKATKSAQNSNPEVLPVARDLNTSLFGTHERFFSWMVVLGELLIPIGVLFFLVIKFPGSRFLLMAIAGLALFMNMLYLSEGVSSSNPPMAFMWLTIIWLAATIPGAALHFAIDVRRLFGKAPVEAPAAVNVSGGQWLFFWTIMLVSGAAAWAMYDFGTYLVVILASIALMAALFAINTLLVSRQHGVSRSAQKRVTVAS
jgi:hypothetical protein